MDTNITDVISIINTTLNIRSIDEKSEVGSPPEWDSLSHIDVIMQIEAHYKIKISPVIIAKLTSVQLIYGWLKEQS